MGILLADNFDYKSRKPLDGRILYDTLVDMAGMADAVMYDGAIAFNKEDNKFYTFNSANTVDATTGKWRELTTGGNGFEYKIYEENTTYNEGDWVLLWNTSAKIARVIQTHTVPTTSSISDEWYAAINLGKIELVNDNTLKQYLRGGNYQKHEIIIDHNDRLYFTTKAFEAANVEVPDGGSGYKIDYCLAEDLRLGNIIPFDKPAISAEYVIGNSYKKGQTIIKDEKLYLVLVDFTASDFDAELANKNIISVDTDLDTHSIAYIQNAEYKKGNLIVYDEKLYIALNDFTSDNTAVTVQESFEADIAAENISAVNIDTDTHTYEYVAGDKYVKGNLIIYNEILYLVKKDFTATDFSTDFNNLNLVKINDNRVDNYIMGAPYQENTLLRNVITNELYIAIKDFNASVADSVYENAIADDITKGNIIKIGGSGDAELAEDITSNLAVGNIKAGDSFLTGTTFTEFVKKLLIKEILPKMTFTAQDSGLKLKGTTAVRPDLTVSVTLGSGTVQKVEFYRDGVLESSQEWGPGVTYLWVTNDITTDTTVQAKVYYTESDGVTTGVLTQEAKYKFMNYSYSGCMSVAPTTEAEILTLTTNLKDTKAYTATVSPADQHIVYAYPASLGTLTSIKDANNFEYIQSYTRTTIVVNGENYNVYHLTDKVTANGIEMKFN